MAVFRLENVRKLRLGAEGHADFELIVSHAEISHGARIGISGASGCGKSTLVELLVFAIKPTDADRFLFRIPDGIERDILQLWRNGKEEELTELRKRFFGVVLQSGGLLQFATVRQNILMSRRILGLEGDRATDELAQNLGIGHLMQKFPGTLSVGERQRVAIARALAHSPAIVVADEPTAALDRLHAERTMDLFLEVVSERGATLIVTSHDEALLDRYGFCLLDHKVEWDGSGDRAVSHFWNQD